MLQYCSTRNSEKKVSSAQAILKGISTEGGLFVPCSFPVLAAEDCVNLAYNELAAKVLSLYLTDYSDSYLTDATNKAYGENFAGKAGEIKKIDKNLYSLELWHGPTCAFKDYALQLMPHLLVEAKKMLNDNSMTKILVATSGDTGTAALNGYCNLDGIKIAAFYPLNGTSEVQRLQMETQSGNNVSVFAVKGNFDNVQTAVKKVFVNSEISDKLLRKGEKLSSANSINWGRLAPQIVYYFYSYCQLIKSREIGMGETLDFCVPTGNFGDILAGYYAKCMGLPIGKLICASNKNNILADFLSTGIYNINRDFHKTSSPSMDILISSNLERLLFHLTNDSTIVAHYMQCLAQTGEFKVSEDVLSKIKETFMCGWTDDYEVQQEIKNIFENKAYLCDTHTAVAFNVHAKSYTSNPCVIVSTASPYKFSNDVVNALDGSTFANEFDAMEGLHKLTKLDIPKSLLSLRYKEVLFNSIISSDEIMSVAENL